MNDYSKAVKACLNGMFEGKDEHLSECDYEIIPSKSEICSIVEDIRETLFPRFFWSEYCSKKLKNANNECEKALLSICDRLCGQVETAFSYEREKSKNAATCEAIKIRAKEVVDSFLCELPNVFEMLRLDVQATLEGDPAAVNYDIILLTYPGIEATFIYRLAHVLFKLNVPLIPRIMTEYAHSKTGIDIHPGATIGKSFVIDHGTGVVIGETTEIGDGVKLYQGVTLGAISLKDATSLVGKKRHPTVKNNVTIYSGATVLGGETVLGEGAIIGSSAFITKSVESGNTVAIEKPKLRIYSNNPTVDNVGGNGDKK